MSNEEQQKIEEKIYEIVTNIKNSEERYNALAQLFDELKNRNISKTEQNTMVRNVRDRIKKEINERIINGVSKGESFTNIAKDVGLTISAVAIKAKALGIHPKSNMTNSK